MSSELRYVLLRHDRVDRRRRLLADPAIRAVYRLGSGAVVVEVEGDLPEILVECGSITMSLEEVEAMGLMP